MLQVVTKVGADRHNFGGMKKALPPGTENASCPPRRCCCLTLGLRCREIYREPCSRLRLIWCLLTCPDVNESIPRSSMGYKSVELLIHGMEEGSSRIRLYHAPRRGRLRRTLWRGGRYGIHSAAEASN